MPVSVLDLQGKITIDSSQAEAALASTGQAVDDLAGTSQSSAASLQTVGAGMTLIGGAGVAGFGAAVGVAADFEAQLSAIASVGGADAVAAMDAIRETALQLGADTAFSASEAAAGMEELIKAGLPVADVLDGAAQAALDLSAATGTDVVTSAETMATALNVFSDGMEGFNSEGEKAVRIADLFAQATNASAGSVDSLSLGFSSVATVADMFGMSIDDTTTALALMEQAGIKGSDAGTSVKAMLLSLTRQTKPAKEALGALGLTFDDFYDSAGNFVGIEDMFTIFEEAMSDAGYTAQQTQDAFAQLFGTDGIRAASVFFEAQDEGWANMRAGMDSAGSAQEQAAIRLDNLSGAMETMRGSIETAVIVIGSALIPAIGLIVEGVTAATNAFLNLPAPIQTAVAVIGALGSVLTAGLGAAILIVPKILAFQQAISELGVAAKLAGLAFGPVGIAIAAVGLAVVAYQTNFLGFADAVNLVAGNVQMLLMPAFLAIQGVISTLTAAFTAARADGLDPLAAAFTALTSVFPAFSGAFATAEALIRNFVATLQGIGEGLALVIAGLARWDLGMVLQGIFAMAEAVITGFVANAGIILSGFGQLVVSIFQGLGGLIGPPLQAASDAVMAWLQGLADAILARFNEAWAAVAVAVAPAWAVIQAAITGAWATIQEAIGVAIATIQTTIETAWTTIQAVVGTAATTIQETVITAWNTIQTDVVSSVDALRLAITEAWELIQIFMGEKAAAIQETVTTSWEAIQATVGERAAAAQLAIETAWTTIQTAVTTAQEVIQTTITTAWTTIQTEVTTIASALSDALGETFETIKTTITTKIEETKTGLLTTLTTMKDEAITTVSGLKDGIVALFADAGSWLIQAGKDIIGGLIDGILSMGGAVGDAVASVIPTDIGMPTLDFLGGGGGESSGGGGGGGGGSRRALGGPVMAMQPYWVGEEGPELFFPGLSGYVMPHRASAAYAAGAGRGGGDTSITIQTLTLPGVRNAQQFAAELLDLAGDRGQSRLVMAGRG